MGAATLALTMGGLAAISSLSQTGQQNAQAKMQKAQMEANAQAARNQAKITAEKGRIEAENLDREKSALRRSYADLQAGNIANLGALGVDMSSGSAASALEGNAQRFAADVGANRAYAMAGGFGGGEAATAISEQQAKSIGTDIIAGSKSVLNNLRAGDVIRAGARALK